MSSKQYKTTLSQRLRSKKWQKANTTRHRENCKKWNKANPERHKEIKRKWNKANPEYFKQWRRKNPERSREIKQKWAIENREKIREKDSKWNKANPEYFKQWRRKNPRSNTNYSMDLQDAMNNVRKRDNNTCQWQGCRLTFKQTIIHVHHIFPRSEYPELELVEQYMICYCANHHSQWHQYRKDSYANLIKSQLIGIKCRQNIGKMVLSC